MPPAPRVELAFVTGKGGVGKSTVSLALALAARRRGRPAVLCEIGPLARAPEMYGLPPLAPGARRALAPGLDCIAVDPTDALREWLARKVGRPAAALLTRSEALGALVAAAPGARELTTIGKAWDLGRRPPRPLVVVDAPSTGHALALLRAPATFGTIATAGPVGREARMVRDALRDPARTALVAVTAPTELAVAETLQLDAGLRAVLGRGPDLLVVDGVLPARFTAAELERLRAAATGRRRPLDARALRAAQAHRRRRTEQRAALRGLAALSEPVRVELPFLACEHLDLAGVEALSGALGRAAARTRLRSPPQSRPVGRPDVAAARR